jgi:hypothetical protein
MRVRFTVRRSMVAIAAIAVLCVGVRWVSVMRHRARLYHVRAEIQDAERQMADVRATSPISTPDEQVKQRKASAWHAARRDLYERAASRPWIEVTDDDEPPIH